MSYWGTLEARFKWGASRSDVTSGMPTGSEGGADFITDIDGYDLISGRLRDVNDMDSFAVVAWFAKHCIWSVEASLMWELDDGPRYRFEWDGVHLRRLRGLLDG